MPDYILVQGTTANWERAEEKDLPREEFLQDLVRDHPEILPLDDLGDDVPPLLIVGREAPLANGVADVIGVDQDGLVTVIECKLARNPEVKRKVIGQILGYAAYLWKWSYEQFETDVVRNYFDGATCHRADLRGVALDEAIERFRTEQALGGDWDRPTFREQLQNNLSSGHFRLIIVVDRVNDELRRTVEYLNACTESKFEILCSELRYFETPGTKLIIPALVGVPAVKPRLPPRAKHKWDEAQFMAQIEERVGHDLISVMRQLLSWCQAHFDDISWGEGAIVGAWVPAVASAGKRLAKPMAVYGTGLVEVAFDWLRNYPPFTEEAKRIEFLERLNEIEGFRLPADAHDRRPTFRIELLAKPEVFSAFTDALTWVIEEIRTAAAREASAEELG